MTRLSHAAMMVVLGIAFSAPSGLGQQTQPESAAPSWPQFHGPNRDSISTETGLLKEWPAEGPRLVWHSPGHCVSTGNIAIAGGRIYLAGTVGKEHFLEALDMDGKPLWRSPHGQTDGKRGGSTSSTPTWRDGRVYQIGPKGRLAAFDAATGAELWVVDLIKEFGARYGMYGIAESVSVDGDQVICSPGGPKGLMVGLDRQTGQTRWAVTQPDDEAAYCTPLLVTWKGVRQAVTVTRQFVVSVDINAGKLLWAYPFKTGHGENAVTPIFRNGLLFVTTSHETGSTMLRINADQRGVEPVWSTQEFGNCHGGVVLVGDNLYGSGCKQHRRAMMCLDIKTGAVRQADRGINWGSLLVADGRLCCRTGDGWLYLLEPTADGFKTISRFRQSTNSGCLIHPVVCGGRLYVRFRSGLWAYDIRAAQ